MFLDEFSGLESFTPSEGGESAKEITAEDRQRFEKAQAEIKEIIKHEKKARKRDSGVANAIVQFLGDQRYSHLFPLIADLSALNCPSIFTLGILSLIHQGSRTTVEEYIREHNLTIATPDNAKNIDDTSLPADQRQDLLQWIARVELIIKIDTEAILKRLMTDHENIDGTVLQITTFVLRDYFESIGRQTAYEELQPLTVKILQDIIGPHMSTMQEYFDARKEKEDREE